MTLFPNKVTFWGTEELGLQHINLQGRQLVTEDSSGWSLWRKEFKTWIVDGQGRSWNRGSKGEGEQRGRLCGGKKSFWARWGEGAGGWGGRWGREGVAGGLGPCLSRRGLWTEVAKCIAMDLMAECRVIWTRKLPGQGGQTSPLDEGWNLSSELRHRAEMGNVAMNSC